MIWLNLNVNFWNPKDFFIFEVIFERKKLGKILEKLKKVNKKQKDPFEKIRKKKEDKKFMVRRIKLNG